MRKNWKLITALGLLFAVILAGSVFELETYAEESVSWTLEGNTLTVTGFGPMKQYTAPEEIPWYEARDAITTVVVEEGITSLSPYAFYKCGKLAAIALPDTLTRVGEASFAWCDALEELRLPAGVAVIEKHTFWGCTALKKITLPQKLYELGEGAFFQCKNLTEIQIPDGVTVLEQSTFAQCENLNNIVLHDEIVILEESVFSRCYALKHLSLPANLQSIGRHAFFGCVQLSELTLPQRVSVVDAAAFYGCDALHTLRFSGDAPIFSLDAFLGLTASIYYPVQNATWNGTAGRDYGGAVNWVAECIHEYEIVFTPPTCTKPGGNTHTCIYCGDRFTDGEISALGHSFIAECDEVCDTAGCGYVRTADEEHNYPTARDTVCSACGQEREVEPYTPGDVNGDGTVNNKDATRLFQYLSGWNVEAVPTALDVNGDGAVNNKDATRLFQYLSHWAVEIF